MRDKHNEKCNELRDKYNELVQKYNEQYGVGTVNIDNGEFIPAETPDTTEGTPTPTETAEKVSEKK